MLWVVMSRRLLIVVVVVVVVVGVVGVVVVRVRWVMLGAGRVCVCA